MTISQSSNDGTPPEGGFVTVKQARAWLDAAGWKPRHGGGYERGATGLATMFVGPLQGADQTKVFVEIKQR